MIGEPRTASKTAPDDLSDAVLAAEHMESW
jgi:hypothetical protein